MINDRRQLADVYQQTIEIVLEGHYTSENGEEVKLPDYTKMLKESRFYTKPLDASNIPPLAEGSTKIIVKNDDSIVLGAFGCGAFQNPPKHIARLFHEVIDEEEFKDKYKLIAFAILEDHNSPRGGNLQPFIEEFKS